MSDWTPGPWKRGSCDSNIIWAGRLSCTDWVTNPNDPRGEQVALGHVMGWGGPEYDRQMGYDDLSPETHAAMERERDANATLIAACPTMAEYIAKRAAAGDAEAQEIWEAINVRKPGEGVEL